MELVKPYETKLLELFWKAKSPNDFPISLEIGKNLSSFGNLVRSVAHELVDREIITHELKFNMMLNEHWPQLCEREIQLIQEKLASLEDYIFKKIVNKFVVKFRETFDEIDFEADQRIINDKFDLIEEERDEMIISFALSIENKNQLPIYGLLNYSKINKKRLESGFDRYDPYINEDTFNLPYFSKIVKILFLVKKYELWYDYYKWVIEYKTKPELPIKRDRHTLLSYDWQSKPMKDLPLLYNLIIGKFIDPETTLEQFIDVFTKKPMHIIIPIKWHHSTASEVLYFIIRLEEMGNIKDENRTSYKRLTGCFVKPDGKPFNANFKVLKQSIAANLSKEIRQSIDEIVEKF